MAENPQRNLNLSRLLPTDFDLLSPHLEDVGLPVRKNLERASKRINTIYFPESGFASVVANGASKRPIEVGIIGREGMTGLAVILGGDHRQSASRTTHMLLCIARVRAYLVNHGYNGAGYTTDGHYDVYYKNGFEILGK